MGGIYIKGVLPGGASDNKIAKGMSCVTDIHYSRQKC